MTAPGRYLVAPIDGARARRRLSGTRRGPGRVARVFASFRWPGAGDPLADAEASADLLDDLARAVRAGAGVEQAVREVGTDRPGTMAATLRSVVAAGDAGLPLIPELRRRAAEPGAESHALRILSVGVRVGAPLADLLHATAAAHRREIATRRDSAVQASQAQASAAVIAALPVVFVGLSALVAPAVPVLLVTSTLGWSCLLGGVTLDLIGLRWMQGLTRGVLER